MSFFISVGILAIATLLQASMQLVPGIFTIFYHYARGKYSRRKADDLALFFVIGTIVFSAIFFLSLYTVYFSIFYHLPDLEMHLFPWIMAGVFLGLSIVSFFLYFRKSRGTELFISRSIAKHLHSRAKNASSRTDSFLLGLLSGVAELFFTLPLFIIVAIATNNIDYSIRSVLSLIFIMAPAIPIFSFFTMYHSGYNLAEIQRRRVKNKTFFRFMIVIGYFLLVFAAINIGIAK